MKKLNALNLGKSLNRAEVKAIKGGKLPPSGGGGGVGSTTCYGTSKVCHDDGNGNVYTCSSIAEPQSEDDCCCGHSDYNDNCIMG